MMMSNLPYYILTFLINGETITVSKTSVYRLLETPKGIEGVDNSLSVSNNASIDGGTIDGEHVNPRRISVSFAVDDKRQTEELRQHLINTLNPKKTGTLIAERNGKRGKIDFRIENRVIYEQKNIRENRLHITVNMLCTDPYFRDVEDTNEQFLQYQPLMAFPLTFWGGAGMTTGILLIADGIRITNAGAVDIGVVITIKAKGGDVVEPKISCNDEHIALKRTLYTDDIAEISTVPGNKGVKINGVSSFQFAESSRFFVLHPGTSDIKISAENETLSNAEIAISYANKWLGV